jgi:hypothetical protein
VGAGTNALAEGGDSIAQSVVIAPAQDADDRAAPPARNESWGALITAACKAQSANPDMRIVRLWHPDAPVSLWHGPFGGAPVEHGPAAYQMSDGTIHQI